MARKGITYEQVAKAAHAIKARGTPPTIAAIREELGGEGSFTTISNHLQKWNIEEVERVDVRQLPPEVESIMSSTITAVWNVANKAASADLAAIKQDHADDTKRLNGVIDAAKKEISELEEKLEKAEDEAANEKGRAANLEKKLAAATGELEATKSLYKQLLDSLKQPAATEKKAVGTKPAHHKAPAAEPENKQGETH